jgi:molybdopterin-guanine dinucleotide biosynthesis protein A
MQRDKNFVVWRGTSLLEHVAQRVSPLCSRVVLVKSHADQPLPTARLLQSLESVVDPAPGQGPVAALAAGLCFLQQSATTSMGPAADIEAGPREQAVFVTGNDSPCLQTLLVQSLLERLQQSSTAWAVVPRLAGAQSQVFPLCAAYSSRCQSVVLEYWRGGGRSMRGLLEQLPVEWVTEAELREWDPQLLSLINLNTPADLAALEMQT